MVLDFLVLVLLFTVGVAASFAVARLGRIVTLLEQMVKIKTTP